MLPSTVVEIFNTDYTGYSLRNADFRSQRFDTIKYGKHSLRYFGPFLWVKFKCNLRAIPTLKSFKNAVKKENLAPLARESGCKLGLHSLQQLETRSDQENMRGQRGTLRALAVICHCH